MAEQLTLKKVQQLEALKFLADWCKWVVALHSAAIGGVLTLAAHFGKAYCSTNTLPHFLVFLGIVLMLASIVCAAYILFGLPEIIEQLPESNASSINMMKSKYLGFGLRVSQKALFLTVVWGLTLIVLGLFLMLFGASLFGTLLSCK